MVFIRRGGEFRVNSQTELPQTGANVTALPDGGFLVVWESTYADPYDLGIYAQRYNASGQSVGGEFKIDTDTEASEADPSVVVLADGTWLFVWTGRDSDDQTKLSGTGIVAQRFNEDGVKLGGQFQINSTQLWEQTDSSIAALTDGGFVVTFESNVGSGVVEAKAQVYSADGTRIGTEITLNAGADIANQEGTFVSALQGGGFVISWIGDEATPSSGRQVFAQRFGENGASKGDAFRVNTYDDGSPSNVSLAGLNNGGFVLTWQMLNKDGSGAGIFAQRYTETGQPVGEEFQVNTVSQSGQTQPQITETLDGGFVIVWESYSQDGSWLAVMAQRYDSDGQPVGKETQVNTYTDGLQWRADVTVLADGALVAVWQSQDQFGDSDSRDQDGSGAGIFGQKFAAQIFGTSNDNTIFGTKRDDLIDGLDGDDVIKGRNGADEINGSDGADRIEGGAGSDILWGNNEIEGNLSASRSKDGVDRIYGGGGGDELYGNQGADKLFGGGGNDTLFGGIGKDKLSGGGGKDEFVFDSKMGKDIVRDFQDNMDTLVLSSDLFGNNLNVRKVLNAFAKVDGDDVVLDFGADEIRIEGLNSINALRNDMDIV